MKSVTCPGCGNVLSLKTVMRIASYNFQEDVGYYYAKTDGEVGVWCSTCVMLQPMRTLGLRYEETDGWGEISSR